VKTLETTELDTDKLGGIMAAEISSRILRLKAVLERTGLSRSTMYRKIKHGTFPAQVQISERCIGWRESDLEQWLRDPIH